jgi:non-ribosomal peptide synthetase component E (peptide arylation enzyme)
MIAAGEEKRQKYRASGWWGDQTLSDMFLANAAAYPDRIALVDAPNREIFAFGEPRRLSYADYPAYYCVRGLAKMM